jgi:hypothetical protein
LDFGPPKFFSEEFRESINESESAHEWVDANSGASLADDVRRDSITIARDLAGTLASLTQAKRLFASESD